MTEQRHTADPSHLAQLRKFLTKKTDWQTSAENADLTKVLAETEHFVFTAVPDVDEEIIASAEAMAEAGVWRLPYPTCTFEFSARLTIKREITFDGAEFRIIVILQTDPADGEPAITSTFIRGYSGEWIRLTWEHRDTETGEMVSANIYQIRARKTPKDVPMTSGDGHSLVEFEFSTGGTRTDIINAVASCMVMLRTRGIRREKWCGNKPILLNRPEPSNAYTRVMVAEAASEGHGTRVQGHRHRVRLHLRRGHSRNQPHGPGRQYTRQIWIEPCLVGYEEEGRITHDHYEAYPHPETTP